MNRRVLRRGAVLTASSLCLSVLSGCEPAPRGEEPESGSLGRAALSPPVHKAFRVMSYNVRGPAEEDTGAWTWANRRAAVIQRILANSPDIVGTQESQRPTGGPDLPADLLAGLSGTYDVYDPGGGSPKLIFYKKGRFAYAPEVGKGNESLTNPYPSTDKCYPNATGKKISWVGLKDLSSGQVYLVVNTHLAFSAACAKGRLSEADEIADFLKSKPSTLPVVLMGDFNTDAQSDSTPGEKTIENLEANARLFRTARHDGTTDADTATFNSGWKARAPTGSARLDYILHNGGTLTSTAPSIDRTASSGLTPSDHYALLATLRGSLFAPGSTLTAVPNGASASTQLFFADLNGDGCADRISWNSAVGEGETWWARSRCDGGFDTAVKNEGAYSGVATTRFFFADVNGDKCADKILWRPTLGDGELRVYPSRCDGTFGERVAVTHAGSQSESTRYAFADVTGDGCADLLRWNPKERSGNFETFPARCGTTPSFGAAVVSTAGANTSEGTSVYFADVDGDKRADRILWNPAQEGGKTRVYRSTGAGAFALAFVHEEGTSGVSTSRFYFADVDGDGRADKIFWRPTFREGRMQIYLSSGSDFGSSPVMDNTGFSQAEATSFFFANLDGQGGADKVYWNPGAYNGDSKVFLALD